MQKLQKILFMLLPAILFGCKIEDKITEDHTLSLINEW
jgi:hypothetical protein